MKDLVEKFIELQIQTAPSCLQHASALVCSTHLLALRIGLYTASLVSLTDVLIGWRVPDCDAPIRLLRIQINTGNIAPSPTWRVSPTWRKQKAFSLPGTVALWVFWKAGNSLLFSEAADSPMLADMGRETVYQRPVLSGRDDFTKCSIWDSRACAKRYIVYRRLGISKHRSSVETATQNMRL